MKTWAVVAALGALAWGTHAHAQVPQIRQLGNPCYNGVSCDLGNGALTASNLGVDVLSYGAKCNGTTDDATAINNAIAYLRTIIPGSGNAAVKLRFPSNASCLIKSSPINLTGLSTISFQVDGNGSTLLCDVAGAACLDALGSRWLNIDNMTVIGGTVNTPSIGLQIGRVTASGSADDHTFSRLTFAGNYSFAAVYNRAAETTLWDHLLIFNNNTSAGSYGLVMDGANKWGITSSFISSSIPVGTAMSFNENTFITPSIVNSGTSATNAPIWMEQASRHRYIGGYAASFSPNAIVLDDSVGAINQLYADIHVETTSLTNALFVTGTSPTAQLPGLTYKDQDSFASTALVLVDNTSSVTSVQMEDAHIEVTGFQNGTPVAFSPAADFTVSGNVYVPSTASWTAPGVFSGALCEGNSCTNYGTYVGVIGTVNTYTSSGTLTAAPPGAQWLDVDLWGGGGGGGAGLVVASGTACSGGSGGGGAAHREARIPVASLSFPISFTIGAGGTAGTTSGASGGQGGQSTFGLVLNVPGGGGGAGGQSGANSGGGGGAGELLWSAGGDASGSTAGGGGYPDGGGGGSGAFGSNTTYFGAGGGGGGGVSGGVGGQGGLASFGGSGGSAGGGISTANVPAAGNHSNSVFNQPQPGAVGNGTNAGVSQSAAAFTLGQPASFAGAGGSAAVGGNGGNGGAPQYGAGGSGGGCAQTGYSAGSGSAGGAGVMIVRFE